MVDADVIELPSNADDAIVHERSVRIRGRDVTVNVHDRGPETGPIRYVAHAHWDDKDIADAVPNIDGYTVGEPDASVSGALFNLQWGVFR